MNASKFLGCVFLAVFPLITLNAAMHPAQTISHHARAFCCEREFEQPVAFEKIYVDGSHILSMPNGVFLKHDNGDLEAMRALLSDCQGMYMLRVYTQCSLCGRRYTGKAPADDYDCPLYDKEMLPKVWRSP